jgi:hypothetical protein
VTPGRFERGAGWDVQVVAAEAAAGFPAASAAVAGLAAGSAEAAVALAAAAAVGRAAALVAGPGRVALRQWVAGITTIPAAALFRA